MKMEEMGKRERKVYGGRGGFVDHAMKIAKIKAQWRR